MSLLQCGLLARSGGRDAPRICSLQPSPGSSERPDEGSQALCSRSLSMSSTSRLLTENEEGVGV
eukprot:12752718-Prorocentrum_lima.AAC.1